MQHLIIFLFLLALIDQQLTRQIEADGRLLEILQRGRWKKRRRIVRVVGALLTLVVLFVIGRYT